MLSQVQIKNDQGDFENFKPLVPADGLINSNEVIRPLPEQSGSGYFSSFSICDGLDLGICRCQFDKDYMARFSLARSFFCLGFCIKGQSLSWGSGLPDPAPMTPGRSYAQFFENHIAKRKIQGQQDVLAIAIHISPNFLTKLLNPDHPRDSQSFDSSEKALESRHFYKDHVITPQMTTTIYQILNNPHKGRVGNIYLESKALELIALRLEQVFQPDCIPQKKLPLSSRDRERICRARDLLVKKLSYPPSLRKLAGEVGMSHTHLNKGFKMVFGCTVFEYLRKERLSYARMLIEENPDDLTRIAYESGFCSSSHFAASFLKEYGIRPSEYRKSLS